MAKTDRQIGIRGPVEHGEGGLWASSIERVELRVGEARAVLLVENLEKFRTLSSLADRGLIVVHVPGGPPPAECELVDRLAALCPGLPFHAAFDLDPAGIRIARVVEERTGTTLDATAMSDTLLAKTPRTLPLRDWDRRELNRLRGKSAAFEPLRRAIESTNVKAEQEPLQRDLLSLFVSRYGTVARLPEGNSAAE